MTVATVQSTKFPREPFLITEDDGDLAHAQTVSPSHLGPGNEAVGVIATIHGRSFRLVSSIWSVWGYSPKASLPKSTPVLEKRWRLCTQSKMLLFHAKTTREIHPFQTKKLVM